VNDCKGNLPGRPFLSVDDMVEIFKSAL